MTRPLPSSSNKRGRRETWRHNAPHTGVGAGAQGRTGRPLGICHLCLTPRSLAPRPAPAAAGYPMVQEFNWVHLLTSGLFFQRARLACFVRRFRSARISVIHSRCLTWATEAARFLVSPTSKTSSWPFLPDDTWSCLHFPRLPPTRDSWPFPTDAKFDVRSRTGVR